MIDESKYAFLGKLASTQIAIIGAEQELKEIIANLAMEQVIINNSAFKHMQDKVRGTLNSLRIEVEWLLEACDEA